MLYGKVIWMDKVSTTTYNPDGTVQKTERVEKPRAKRGWLQVLAWQTAAAICLCLGAAGLRHYAPERAAEVRALLVAQEEDPVSQAARCFLEDMAAGETVAEAVAAFYQELTDLAGA